MHATTADGVQLALHHVPAHGSSRGVVLLGHAMMANARSLEPLQRALGRAGLDTFALDFRGHGKSRPPDPRRDRWPFDAYAELDLPAALAAVSAETGAGASEITWVGHSLGGLVGLAHAAPDAPLRRRMLASAYIALARACNGAPIRRLGLGSDDENPAYVAEWGRWALSGRWTSEDGYDYAAALGRVDARVLCTWGGGDWMCTDADAMALALELPRAKVETLRIAKSTGFPRDADHFAPVRDARLGAAWDVIAAFSMR